MTLYCTQDPREPGLSASEMGWRPGELLLTRRSDDGRWGVPDGFVKVADSGVQAVERGDRARRVYIVNLCFEAEALTPWQTSTRAQTLELGFVGADALSGRFVPIREVWIRGGRSGRIEELVR